MRSRRNRTWIALTVVAALALAPSGNAEDKAANFTGWVSDEACGAAHTKPGREDCVRKCLRGGASVGHPEWKAQRMVFVADADGQIWIVENPEALKGFEGGHVQISGQIDRKAKTVRVGEAKTMKEDENPK
jgi:hypothetical protein